MTAISDLYRHMGVRTETQDSGLRVRQLTSRVLAEEPESRDGRPGLSWKVELRSGSWREITEVWASQSGMDAVIVAVRGGPPIDVATVPGSLMDRLRVVARALAREAPWTEEDAAWFVLTGDPPPVAPIAYAIQRRIGSGYHRAVVRLEVEPWVPQQIVLAAYRQAQAQVLPKANRSTSKRTAELARFAATSAGAMSVAAAMRLWNDANPQWVERDRRNFQRRVRQAIKYIAAPRWQAFG